METKTAQALRKLARHYGSQIGPHSTPGEIARAVGLLTVARAYPRCVSEGHKVGFTGVETPYTARAIITRSENEQGSGNN